MSARRIALLAAVPLIAGCLSILAGRDANWDFLNYRWYNPYALLHGKLTRDVLVAGHATFYNPLLELPFYLLAGHVPGVAAGFLLAALDGACFVPLFLLAEQVLTLETARRRTTIAALLALSGLLGGGAIGQVGIVSWDMPLGILTFTALLLVLKEREAALTAPIPSARSTLLLAGLVSGAAAGLKLTAAVYPLGIATAIFFASAGRLRDRTARAALFSLGTAAGILLLGGYWMGRLYLAFGNPVMPYFNGIFHSPYATQGDNRDSTFLPGDWQTALLFPYLFTLNSRRVAEYDFRDAHVALALTSILAVGVTALVRKRAPTDVTAVTQRPPGWATGVLPETGYTTVVRPAALRLLGVAFLVSYAAWEALFSIYRYVVPLEMLAPLVIAGSVGALPLGMRGKAVLAAAILAVAQVSVQAGFSRLPWTRDYVEVHLPYEIPADAMVLMTGSQPLGYVVAFLPPQVPVLRAGSFLARDDRFGATMAERIRTHEGPFYVIYHSWEASAAGPAIEAYDLAISEARCGNITSNVADPVVICPVRRR